MAFNIDTTSPADNMQVSLFPASERAHRVQLENIITAEHDEGTGHHALPQGNEANRNAISDAVPGTVHFNPTEGIISLRNSGDTDWDEYPRAEHVFQPGDIKIAGYDPTTPPSGWLDCDGALYDGTDSDYADLYAAIGTEFNTGGEGVDEFRVPNFEAAVPLGYEAGSPYYGDIGDTGGLAAGSARGLVVGFLIKL